MGGEPSRGARLKVRLHAEVDFVTFFRTFVHLFLAVVRGLAAVSGWTVLGAVRERFPVGQTLPAISLALEPT